jgi:hypothetical protein
MDQASTTDLPPAVHLPTIRNRRRPGRIEYTNPDQIALLRQPSKIIADEIDNDDPLAPARGIMMGLVVAAPMWVGIGLLVWLFLRG